MKTIAVLLVIACVTLSSAWPLKPDDKQQRIREAEEIAARDLQVFLEAYAHKYTGKLAELTRDAIDVLQSAQVNNRKLNKALGPVIAIMDKLANPSGGPLGKPINFLKLRALQLLSNLLDGNRDNFSYYRLDAIREWIERRTTSEGAHDSKELKQAHEHVVAARDALETMASTFVKGLKDIKEETKHVLHEDHKRIKQIADNILKVAADNKHVLIDKTNDSIQDLQKAIDVWFQGEVVTHPICIFPGHGLPGHGPC